MERIKQHKWAFLFVLFMFTPVTDILFGTVGRFVNWGFVALVGFGFAVRAVYPHLRGFVDDILTDDDNEYEWR